MTQLVKTNALPRRSVSYFAVFYNDDDNVPKGAYPPDIKLPAWKHWPIGQKLPRLKVRNGEYFSRGRLGQPLVPTTSKAKPDFLTSKPNLKAPYNPLHDPGLEHHFNKPVVRKVLQKQGLIDLRGFVKCTQKEQNEYREYISESAASQSQIDEFYEKKKAHETEIFKEHSMVLQDKKRLPAKEAKWRRTYMKGQALREEKRKRAIKASIQQQRRYQEQLRKFHEERQRDWELKRRETLLTSKPSQWFRAREQECMDRIKLLRTIEFNEKLSKVRRFQIAQEKQREKEEMGQIMWQRHLQYNFDNEELTALALADEQHDREKRIQGRVTRTYVDYQRNLIRKIYKKREKEERARAAALKYGRRWLAMARSNLNSSKGEDLLHSTSFDIKNLLDCQFSKVCRDAGLTTKHHGVMFGGVSVKELLYAARASAVSVSTATLDVEEHEDEEEMQEIMAQLRTGSMSVGSLGGGPKSPGASETKIDKDK